MTLLDLCYYINDNMVVVVADCATQEEVGRYDGKSSVDEIYNECEVMDITATAENEITIDIDTF